MDKLEAHMSGLTAIESELALAQKRAARLRQAILKKAFEGKLVPQDPNDEPASVLLQRISRSRPERRRRDLS
jgi:type I restriction enzyme S subunit